MKMFRSVRAKFLAVTVPLMALLFTASLGTYEYFNYKRDSEKLLQRIDRFVASRSIILAEPVATGATAQIGLILAAMIADPDIIRIAIYDAKGRVLDSFGEHNPTALVHRASGSINFSDEQGFHVVGRLEVDVGNARILRDLQHRAGFEAIIGIVLIGLASIAVAVGYRRAVARPLERLSAAFAGAESGKSRPAIDWRSNDEMGELISAYNNMQQRLHEDEETLLTLQRELESRVRQRTEELEVAKKAAESASRAKSDFLSSMSHELRTPMNSILGFAQLLADDPKKPLDEEHLRGVRQILRSGDHLLRLIGEVLDLSRIESGQINLSIQDVELRPVFDECLQIVEKLAETRNIVVEDATGMSNIVGVRADRTRLRQILLNLFSNAIKYNRDGGTVKLEGDIGENGRTYIRIRDTGSGIPADKHQNVFEPFERLGAESTDTEGAGIGLALSKRLVESMGGEIGFESLDGKGSVFWFSLPSIQLRNVRSEDVPPPKGRPNITPTARYDGLVLYVEDNPANLELMELIISRMEGVRLQSAHTAELSLGMAETEQPDLILMDINLPGMSGIAALKALRKNPKTSHIPVIAVSGAAMPTDVAIGAQAGFEAYVTKPFTIREIMSHIAQYLRKEALPSDEILRKPS